MNIVTLPRLLWRHGIVPAGPVEPRPLSLLLPGQHVATGRPLVVKVLNSRIAGVRRNFLREIRTLKSLAGRPGVARLVAASVSAHLTFHACERANGRSLDELTNAPDGRDLAVILRHGAILADWLAGLHRLGVAHRDLSPDHVFVGADATITVVDYGMAKRTRRLPPADCQRCEGYDVQAFGMVLWETICGRAIFPYRDSRLPLVLRREIDLVRGSSLPLPVRRFLTGCLAARSEFTPRGLQPHRGFVNAREASDSIRAAAM